MATKRLNTEGGGGRDGPYLQVLVTSEDEAGHRVPRKNLGHGQARRRVNWAFFWNSRGRLRAEESALLNPYVCRADTEAWWSSVPLICPGSLILQEWGGIINHF